jgi:hypothetical protein
VAKRAGAEEEVVIRKEEGEHTEKVRDKLRETKVDVEGGATQAGSRKSRSLNVRHRALSRRLTGA